jgi:hypothetical protein
MKAQLCELGAMETHEECEMDDFIPLDLAESLKRGGLKVQGTQTMYPAESATELCSPARSKMCTLMSDNFYAQYDFVKPILFRGYGVRSANDCPERNPKQWDVSIIETNVHTGEDLNDGEW